MELAIAAVEVDFLKLQGSCKERIEVQHGLFASSCSFCSIIFHFVLA